MLRQLIVILCFILTTYAWAKYTASSESFNLEKVKPNPNWYWPEPVPGNKGLPLTFIGRDPMSYATYMDRFSDPRGYSDYENNFSFSLTFSTLLSRGVLYVDQLDRHGILFVSLHKGNLALTLIHNGIPQIKTISGLVNDLKSHTLKVQRVPGENKVNVTVDKSPVTVYLFAFPNSFRGGINIYLGCIPLSLKAYNRIYDEPSFIGCIYTGQVLNKDALESFSAYNFTTTGDVTTNCKPPTFLRLYGEGNYAEAPFPGEPMGNFNFSFSFKTSSSDGLLFIDLSDKFMYVAIYLKEGHLWIAINDGGLTAEKVSKQPLDDSRVHSVKVQEAGAVNLVWVEVDEHRTGIKFKNRHPFINGTSLVIGGLPDRGPYRLIAAEEKALYAHLAVDISNVRCNNQLVNPDSFKVRQ